MVEHIMHLRFVNGQWPVSRAKVIALIQRSCVDVEKIEPESTFETGVFASVRIEATTALEANIEAETLKKELENAKNQADDFCIVMSVGQKEVQTSRVFRVLLKGGKELEVTANYVKRERSDYAFFRDGVCVARFPIFKVQGTCEK